MSIKYKIRDQSKLHFLSFAVVQWVDVFTRTLYKDVVIDSLRFCQQNKGLLLYAWCIMSNHLYLIISSKENYRQENIIRDFKKHTVKELLKLIATNHRESRKNWMMWLFESEGKRNSNNKKYQFWQQDNHPIELSTNEMMDERLDYVHNNPVEEGIVEKPEDYLYSSARSYAGMPGLLNIKFIE